MAIDSPCSIRYLVFFFFELQYTRYKRGRYRRDAGMLQNWRLRKFRAEGPATTTLFGSSGPAAPAVRRLRIEANEDCVYGATQLMMPMLLRIQYGKLNSACFNYIQSDTEKYYENYYF